MHEMIQSDARNIPLADQSIHCCITSPPYYGLRDYGTGTWSGGSPECDHVKSKIRTGLGLAEYSASIRGGGHKIGAVNKIRYSTVCDKCGAVREDNQIGLEDGPENYIDSLLSVFSEVYRVLKNDGTLWLNMGDSYYNKSLLGMPWRLAMAMCDMGWILRSDIIWHKPNPMPESVTDRPTKSHEYVFLMTKAMSYYYDYEAIKDPSVYPDDNRKSRSKKGQKRLPSDKIAGMRPGSKTYPKRNKRSVWTVATRPCPEAHFATFPPRLVEPMILAGCPPNGTVLDPFVGSGTVLETARNLGRNAVGLDLSLEYLALSQQRLLSSALPLLD